MAEIGLGLGFLHKNGVAFRNIKSETVVIDRAGHVKVRLLFQKKKKKKKKGDFLLRAKFLFLSHTAL